jgi:hypothetical protein
MERIPYKTAIENKFDRQTMGFIPIWAFVIK